MAGTLEEFVIEVGVHQGSALSPLLFITVMEELSKECRGEGPWELLYADDIVLTAETKNDVEQLLCGWKSSIEKRGMKVNLEKTKAMVTGKKQQETMKSGKWPCGCCGKGVGVNSILCTSCHKWCHKRCSHLRSLVGVTHFQCPKCRSANTTNIPTDDCKN